MSDGVFLFATITETIEILTVASNAIDERGLEVDHEARGLMEGAVALLRLALERLDRTIGGGD